MSAPDPVKRLWFAQRCFQKGPVGDPFSLAQEPSVGKVTARHAMLGNGMEVSICQSVGVRA